MLSPLPSSSTSVTALKVPKVLQTAWFTRPTCVVAADLVGKILCRQLTHSDGSQKIVRMRISETEGYIADDPACHAHAGTRTARTEIMYHQGGVFYVYLTYGVHHMLNLVSGQAESPESVLIRAGFLIDNSELSVEAGERSAKELRLYMKQCAGPGKLTKHLHIDRELSGKCISPVSKLWIEDDGMQPPISIRPRIGIDYAGEAKDWLLRYVWSDHPSLSKK